MGGVAAIYHRPLGSWWRKHEPKLTVLSVLLLKKNTPSGLTDHDRDPATACGTGFVVKKHAFSGATPSDSDLYTLKRECVTHFSPVFSCSVFYQLFVNTRGNSAGSRHRPLCGGLRCDLPSSARWLEVKEYAKKGDHFEVTLAKKNAGTRSARWFAPYDSHPMTRTL